MILATTIQSERGKSVIKTANEFIFQEITVKKQKIGEIELYYFNDSVNDPKNCDKGEWLVKFRPCENNQEEEDKPDWNIIAQGNI